MGCSSPCKTCDLTSMSVCNTCVDSYYLLEKNCILLPCPNGYFAEKVEKICKKCAALCLTCEEMENSCLSCD